MTKCITSSLYAGSHNLIIKFVYFWIHFADEGLARINLINLHPFSATTSYELGLGNKIIGAETKQR